MSHKLEVNHLKVSFRTQSGKVQAVRDISFHLDQGETLCIVGESGSGKSVTSKAIMGLLAGNSIVESGRILYDGMDLLKLSRDDMHTIRGNKIAMIFQDPMSSLNPIMRVGDQITEAMLLKNKANRESAKKNFNAKLTLLRHYLDLAYPGEEARNAADCKTLDSFCVLSTRLELEYNRAETAAEDCASEASDLLFLLEKKQKTDRRSALRKILKTLSKAQHPFVLTEDGALKELRAGLSALQKTKLTTEEEEKLLSLLTSLKEKLDTVLTADKPNYFRIGYLLYKNPKATLDMPVAELNETAGNELEEGFLQEFLQRASKAYEVEFREKLEKKQQNLTLLDEFSDALKVDGMPAKKPAEYYKTLSAAVDGAINRMVISKNSAEYTFSPAFLSCLKADTDPEVRKNSLLDIVNQLRDSYLREAAAADSYCGDADAVALIDYFKEQASMLVTYITKGMAKAKAVKLLKEVGIPDPELRCRQYPFEFSGGMRQRIVIAIALAADPEILICDEPTTALDVTIQSTILELINRIKKERKLSVIFITHNLGVVAYMADRVAVMYAGKIVELGTVKDIFYDPRHPYTWALLSSIPDLDTTTELEAIHGTPPNMIFPPKGDAFAERNKYALEIDFELEPPLFELSPTHYAATWLVHPNAPKTERPQIITERIERMKSRTNHGQN